MKKLLCSCGALLLLLSVPVAAFGEKSKPSKKANFVPFEIKVIEVDGKEISCARKKANGKFLSGVVKRKKGKETFVTNQSKIAALKSKVSSRRLSSTSSVAKKLKKLQTKTKQWNRFCKTQGPGAKGGPLHFVQKPQVVNISGDSATIAFETNVDSDAEVNYAEHHGSAGITLNSAERTTSHFFILSGLTPKTTYHLGITAKDKKGNKISEHVHLQTTDGSSVAVEFSTFGILRLREGQTIKYDISGKSEIGAVKFSINTTAPFAALTDQGNGSAVLVLSPGEGTRGDYPYEIIATDPSGQQQSVANIIKVYPALPPHQHNGEPGFYVGMHSDPFIPNFSFPEVTTDIGLNRVETTRGGNWSELFPNLSANTALVIKHNVIFDTNALLDTIVIYPGGSLKFRTDKSTRLSLVTLQVMEQGLLEIGSEAAPVASNVTAEIVFRDVPFNLDIDPGQFGHGLMNHGTVRMHGRPIKNTFLRVANELAAGDSVITMSGDVSDWKAGDKLIFPDSTQVRHYFRNPHKMKWEENEVAGVQGSVVTLKTALQFAHPGARNIDGKLEFLPHVGNLGRNVILRSENPDGVRGHTINFGHAAWDLRYVGFVELGRTLAVDPNADLTETSSHLHSTAFDGNGLPTQIGRNQIGRYAVHNHHAHGPREIPGSGYQQVMIGNAVDGSPKWGIVLHGTHFSLARDNVVYRAVGAGIITENAAETHNVIEKNFVMRSVGSGQSAIGRALGAIDFAHEGSGFWFHGSNNFVRNNVSANNTFGYNIFHLSMPSNLRYPLAQGDDPTEEGQYLLDPDPRRMQILQFQGNEAYSQSAFGVELWTLAYRTSEPGRDNPNGELLAGVPTLKDTIAWHNGDGGIKAGSGRPNNFVIDGLTVRQELKAGNEPCIGFGVHSSSAYTSAVRIRNADIQGAERAVADTRTGLIVEDSYLRSCVGYIPFKITQNNNLFDNVKIDPIPGVPFRGIVYKTEHLQEGSSRLTSFSSMLGSASRFLVFDHQKIPGNDYELFLPQQLPDSPVIGRGIPGVTVSCPEAGMTAGACWNKYGFAINDQLATCASTQPEFEVGAACPNPTEDVAYHAVPRALLSNIRNGNKEGQIFVYGVITGDPAKMDIRNSYMIQLDNSEPEKRRYQDPDNRSIYRVYENLAAGQHTVQAWLLDKNGNELPGSRHSLTFSGPTS